MMRSLFSRIHRRLGVGIFVLIASTVLFVGGMISIVVALSGGGADLPGQGSLDAIIDEASPDSGTPAAPTPSAPLPPIPTRLAIPRLYIDAPVITMTMHDNVPEVPDRPDQVAWYDFTYRPGQANNAVFSGHVDWQTRTGAPIPGVFYRLRELEIGDTLVLTQEDGTQLKYTVTGNVAAAYEDPNIAKAMGPTSRDSLTLITCGGSWQVDRRQQYGGNYSHRIVVRAERTLDVAEELDLDSEQSVLGRGLAP